MADWGLTGGEVDILLGADMIHLFPKLDHTVGRLHAEATPLAEATMTSEEAATLLGRTEPSLQARS